MLTIVLYTLHILKSLDFNKTYCPCTLSKTQDMSLTHDSNQGFLPMGTTNLQNIPYVIDGSLDQFDSALHGCYQLIIIRATS